MSRTHPVLSSYIFDSSAHTASHFQSVLLLLRHRRTNFPRTCEFQSCPSTHRAYVERTAIRSARHGGHGGAASNAQYSFRSECERQPHLADVVAVESTQIPATFLRSVRYRGQYPDVRTSVLVGHSRHFVLLLLSFIVPSQSPNVGCATSNLPLILMGVFAGATFCFRSGAHWLYGKQINVLVTVTACHSIATSPSSTSEKLGAHPPDAQPKWLTERALGGIASASYQRDIFNFLLELLPHDEPQTQIVRKRKYANA